MADSKITALTAISTVDPAADPLVIVDVSDTSMAASGTTKKGTINQFLGAGGTATLASATITGDLTVDTNVLKVDTTNNRVGFGTASPAKRCEINQSANAFTTIGEGEILRLIGDDGNTVGRITEIGFGTGPTGAVYAPVTLGAINTSITGYNHKAFYIATRTGTSDVAPVERYRIANDGVATWSNVGGVAGTAMTLNATGLGVGGSPLGKFDVYNTGADTTTFIRSDTTRLGQIVFRDNADSANQGRVKYDHSTDTLSLYSGGNENVFLSSSGNVGIGVTPSAWDTNYKALQLGYPNFISGNNGGNIIDIGVNAYFNTDWKYAASSVAATRYRQVVGVHQWYTAPSGTAGNAITWTQAMTLDASGRLILLASTTTPATLATNGELTFTATSNTNLRFSYRGSDGVTRTADLTLA